MIRDGGWVDFHPSIVSLVPKGTHPLRFTAVNCRSTRQLACSVRPFLHCRGNQNRRGRSRAGWSFHLGRI